MANYTNDTNVGMDTASATASDQVGGGVVGAMGAVPKNDPKLAMISPYAI
jgi:hypothetical protein